MITCSPQFFIVIKRHFYYRCWRVRQSLFYPGHRALVLASLIGGAAFVAWADILTRVIPATGHIPLGVVTGLIGAPVFLFLLAKAAREGRLA